MRDLRKYWQEINALEKSLPDYVWIASVKDGGLVEVKATVAAKLMHAKTHRLATEQEMEDYRLAQNDQRRRAFHEELRRKGIAVVPVSGAGRVV